MECEKGLTEKPEVGRSGSMLVSPLVIGRSRRALPKVISMIIMLT